MADLIKRFFWWIATTVVGFVLWVGYVSVCSSDHDDHEIRVSEMPTQLYGGGQRPLGLVVRTSDPAQLYVVFENAVDWDRGEEPEIVVVETPLQPGNHEWTVDIPDHTYLSADVTLRNAPVGASASVTVRAAGEWIYTDDRTLDEPLKEGYVFAVGTEIEDWGGYGF